MNRKRVWRRNRISHVRGFTLVELLIAASILGMVSLAVLSAFGTGFYTFGRVQAFSGASADVLLSLDRLEREVRNSFPSAVIGFEGESQRIAFPLALTAWDEEKQEETVSVGQMSYYWDGQKKALIGEYKDYARSSSSPAAEPAAEVLAYVEDLHFSYYFHQTEVAGEEKKIEYGWKSSWTPQDEGIPCGVKVELIFTKEGREVPMARTVFIPAGGSVVVQEEGAG